MLPKFDLERLSEVIRKDATNTTQVDFLATHTAFKNLKYSESSLTGKSSKVIDEETLFQTEIMGKRNAHQFIVVQGDNGTGKSHFIRWVKERYLNQVQSEEEAVLLIVRSQNTLRGALEQIINSDILPSGFRLNELKKLVEANQHLNADTLKKTIIVHFAIAADQAFKSNDFKDLDRRYLKNVYDFLVDQTVGEHLSRLGGPVERIQARLTPESSNMRKDDIEPYFSAIDLELSYDFLQKMEKNSSSGARKLADELASSDKGPEIRTSLSRFLNKNLEFVIQSVTSLKSSDLKHVFEELRKELKLVGKNLTLFIEDITSFTGIDRALVEVLVTEHTENNAQFCRIFSLVGITNDYYNTNFPKNLQERVTGFVYLDKATLLNQDELAEMASRYLNAIQIKKNLLEEWVAQGAQDELLPVVPIDPKQQWAVHKLLHGQETSIFPFNKQSLWNMFTNLPKSTQTPRRFLIDVLSHVIRTYNEFSGRGEFPPKREEFEGEFEIPQWRHPQHERPVLTRGGNQGEQILTLLRVWGDGTAFTREENGRKTVGSLSQEVFESFGFSFIEGILDDSKSVSVKDKKNEVSEASVPLPNDAGKQSTSKSLQDYEKIKKELDTWIMPTGKLPSYVLLRDDVCDLLIDYIDWEMEGVPGNLVGAFLNNRRLSIEGQTGIIYEGFQVPKNKQSQYALQALAAWRHLGSKSWNYDGADDDLANLQVWLISIKPLVIRSILAPSEVDQTKWELPNWGLLVEFMSHIITGQFSSSKSSTEDIYHKIFQPSFDVVVEENRSGQWRALQTRIKQSSTKIKANHDFIIRYFNRVQGVVTGSTEVFFVDAYEVLTRLEKLRKTAWDFKKNVDETVFLMERKDNVWYTSLTIADLIMDLMSNVLEEEKIRSREIVNQLECFIGADFNEEDVKTLFREIEVFLNEILPNANENFRQKDFENLLDGTLTSRKFNNAIQLLKAAEFSTQIHESLMRYSAHPNGNLQPYLDILNRFEKLTDEKAMRYEQLLLSLAQSNTEQSVDIVLQETKQILTNLRDHLREVGGEE